MSQNSLVELLEVVNFKSYRGKNKLGPLARNLNVVMEPTGSGVSNDIVDAIRFVMGEEAPALCVEDLDQLTYEVHVGHQSTGVITSVALVFSLDHGLSRRKYTRVIVGPQQSEYKIDDLVVSVQQYTDSLQELGISVAAKNVLVLQGTVESIALKDPKKLTEWFEEISGSKMLKDSYESLRGTVLGLEDEIKELSSLKQAKIREMKTKKNEAKWYKELLEKKSEFQLVRLFHNELKIQSLDEDIANKKTMFKEVDEKITFATESSCKLKEKLENALLKLAEVENKISSMKLSSLMTAKERIIFVEKKLNSAEASLEKAKQAEQVCGDTIQSLEQELFFVDAEKQNYKHRLAADTGQVVVQLADDQIEEFQNLKLRAQIQSDEYFWELDSINCEQNADRDELDFQNYRQVDLVVRISGKTQRKEEMRQRVEELTECILASMNTLDEQNRLHKELKDDADDSLKNRIPRLQSDLLNVLEQLDEVQTTKYGETRRQEKLKLIEKLKIFNPGVYDRVVNMCHPVSEQYSVASNRLLEQYLDAIIVDTKATADVCLVRLRDYFLSPETFLPLDSLRAEPFNECLRKIREPEGVKLAHDVLKFDHAISDEIAPFLTNNTLICETSEDAKLVREKTTDEKCRVVIAANDGTSFHECGVVSRGSPDTSHPAQRRDDDKQHTDDVWVSQLKSSKENLMNELHETLKLAARKESEITTVDSQLEALTEHLRNIEKDRELVFGQIDDLEKELRELKEELDMVDSRIEEIKSRMRQRDLEAQETEERVNRVEESVFADFCFRNGMSMSDIRQYEERHDSSSYREHMRERFLLKIKKYTIVNRLNFQRQMLESQESDVQRWKSAVHDYKQALEEVKFAENREARETEKYEVEINHARTIVAAQKREIDSMEADLGEVNGEIDQLRKKIPDLQETAISWLEDKLDMTKWERYQIFRQSRVEGVTIPLLLGNVEEIVEDFASTEILYDRLSRIVIDYSTLSSELTGGDSPSSERVREKESELAETINDLSATLKGAHVPGYGDDIQRDMLLISDETEELQEKFISAQRRAKEARENFERVKEERNIKFQNCFNHVLHEINNVYKALYQNESMQVFLKPENSVEPYLDGIDFTCATPDNPRQLHHLAGREQIIAALALLLTFHSNEPAPFLILDRIDDSLDDINARKLFKYIRHHQRNQLQTIVISSNETFYSQANYLVGLYSVKEECMVGKLLAINLDNYQ